MSGTLNIVSTPIGNFADMTFRALKTLSESDVIVCEEFKEGVRLLKFFEINKDLKIINEHNEKESSEEVFMELVSGKNVSLISDCGTPLFSDPGKILLNKCIEFGIKTEFIGGANSLLASIVLSGFDISRFYFLGFLSPKTEIRKKELKRLTSIEKVMVIMDAPYRLKALLNDIKEIFPERKLFVAFNITEKSEMHFRGTAADILNEIGEENKKGEFIIFIDKHDNNLQVQS
ncbi:MAG: Ribosomal RNA small subunit methyltransferase I [Ignavibacteria bacterium]|nr:Ribosomal RNA small subunit methyltransferase I [Ignavibacteria bacterium]